MNISLIFKFNTPSLNTNLTEAAEAKVKGGDLQESLNHLDKLVANNSLSDSKNPNQNAQFSFNAFKNDGTQCPIVIDA